MRPTIHNRVRSGDRFLAAWRRINEQVNRQTPKLLAHPILKKRVTPHGTIVKNFSPDTWNHPFRIGVSNDYVAVAPGTVNGIIPYMNTAGGKYIRLNGLNENGEVDFEDGIIPVMELDKSKINEDRTSYVMIKVKRNKTSGTFGTKLDNEDNTTVYLPEDLEIVIEKEFDGPTASGTENEYGYHPIGMVQFANKSDDVVTFFQICHFNLRYAFQDRRATLAEIAKDPDKLTIGRHVFYPS